MRVGVVVLPTEPWTSAGDVWRHLDDSGFHSGWVYDHLRWSGWRRGPWYGAWPTLAGAAQVTARLRIGTLVANPNLHHPVTLAQHAVTVDELSAGRLELGVGAGSAGPDAAVLGGRPWTPAERAGRFGEFVTLLDRLLIQPVTTWRGEHYSAVDAVLEPGCRQRPRVPFTVAAAGGMSLRLAARLGQRWVTTGPPAAAGRHDDRAVLDAVRRQRDGLEEACRAAGRDPATIDRMFLHMGDVASALDSADAFEDLAGRYAELGFTDLAIHYPRPEPPFAGDPGVLDVIAGRL